MFIYPLNIYFLLKNKCFFVLYELHFKFDHFTCKVFGFTSYQLLEIHCTAVYNGPVFVLYFLLHSFNPLYCDQLSFVAVNSLHKFLPCI